MFQGKHVSPAPEAYIKCATDSNKCKVKITEIKEGPAYHCGISNTRQKRDLQEMSEQILRHIDQYKMHNTVTGKQTEKTDRKSQTTKK